MTDFVALTEWAWMFGVLGLVASAGAYGYVIKQPQGNETMIELGERIHAGAMAFLRREYIVLSVFVVGLPIFHFLTWPQPVGTLTFSTPRDRLSDRCFNRY
jgi:K(+)-stimulated pyrophosphate-energized sodium pump